MVRLICSDKVQTRLVEALEKQHIIVADDSDIVLVEQGYDLPTDGIGIYFDPMDYKEVVELLVDGVKGKLPLNNTVTGFANNRYTVLALNSILYIEVNSDGLYAYTLDNSYSLKKTLNYYEQLWKRAGFYRVNKSTVVNLLNVTEIIPWFNSRYVLKFENKSEVEVSKLYSKTLRNVLKI